MNTHRDAVSRACQSVMKPPSRSQRMREAAPDMYELLRILRMNAEMVLNDEWDGDTLQVFERQREMVTDLFTRIDGESEVGL